MLAARGGGGGGAGAPAIAARALVASACGITRRESSGRLDTSATAGGATLGLVLAGLVDLAGEVQKSIGYYTTMNRDADLKHMLLLGHTAHLPGLRKLLEQQLQFEVKRLEKFSKVAPPDAVADKFKDNLCPWPRPTAWPSRALASNRCRATCCRRRFRARCSGRPG